MGAGKQTKGATTLYINFIATLEGTSCTIEPVVPYQVTSNGNYKFTASGTYNGKTVTKEIEVTVNQYEAPQGVVQYDAGDWTEEEINQLNTAKLYDLNASHSKNNSLKLKDESGLNFTFGGFTYKGDTANENTAGVITSRNKSVSPESGYGTPKYDGWQVLESNDENGKTYVTKLVHAGTPENFVYYYTADYDAARAEYLLSSGTRQTSYNKLSDNTTEISTRNWDMYKDKNLDELGYIKEVHAMTCAEADGITNSGNSTNGIRSTGSCYWLASTSYDIVLWGCDYRRHHELLLGRRRLMLGRSSCSFSGVWSLYSEWRWNRRKSICACERIKSSCAQVGLRTTRRENLKNGLF